MNHKILVLSDLSNSLVASLKSAVAISRAVGGDIQLFYVKKPTSVVDSDNQLSAIRTINDEYTSLQKKMNFLVKPITDEYKVDVQSSFVFGNVKTEIEKHIKEIDPDIIILGKRTNKPVNFGGDSITQFVLNTFKGTVLIASDEHKWEPHTGLSIGLVNEKRRILTNNFVEGLLQNATEPVRYFNISGNSDSQELETAPDNVKTVDYVFEKADSSYQIISKYIAKGNVNMLCLDRHQHKDIKSVMSKLNTSLLFTESLTYA